MSHYQVFKTTLEVLKFEAELEDRNKLKNVLARLDGRKVKLTGYNDYAQVRATEAKSDFPSRHDWDTFFRDAKNMDEMKAGERPDTMYLSNLPIKWFCSRHHENEENVKPSEVLFKRIFEKFGEVKLVDIPICDPYRHKMKSGLTGLRDFSFENDMYFEGYIQFSEYGSFVRAMDEFRGMKLVRKDVDKLLAVNINVTFDKTKHLNEANIKRRKFIRDRLIEKDREKAELEEKKIREEQEKNEKEKKLEEEKKKIYLEKQRQREERRKQKYIQKISQKESIELTKKIHKEQRKLLKTQRKVESIRLLEALLDRIKTKCSANDRGAPIKDFKCFDLRTKIHNNSSNSKIIHQDDIKKERSLSIASISSNDSILTPLYHGMVRPYVNPNFHGRYPTRPWGSRNRGRGRGYYSNYNYNGRYKRNYNDDDDYYNDHDRRSPRRNYSRSYSRSRSRSRSHRRRRSSYSRSRSRSQSRSSKSSRSRTPKRSSSRKHKTKSRNSRSVSKTKLVTTLRDGDINKPPPSSRRNRSRSGSAWTSDGGRKSDKSRKSWSREASSTREKISIEPEKLLKNAREIQLHVQQKLKEQEESKEKKMLDLFGSENEAVN
ncbi:CLUMA_CG011516, isoform A [Clunio marinus]|uniref:CLUMA_CG011516, isoform A n=1 Tax=Clunio marinus TaxID=568069 RepID=A0A1J1IF17_9DIPT|nr:CLUMA_CG011516, isoform A [Clunio marinus]